VFFDFGWLVFGKKRRAKVVFDENEFQK